MKTTPGATANRQVEEIETVVRIPIGEIHPAPDNLRRSLGDMEELTASVKANGILQPITVEPRDHDGYQVVMGHRRLAAAQLAKLDRVPAIVRTFRPGDRIVAMGVENLQRENLTPTEEAELYRRLTVDEGLSQRVIASITGSSQTRVAKRLALLKLPELAVQAVDSGRLGLDEAAELASLAEDPGFAGAVATVLDPGGAYARVSSREIPRYVKVETDRAVAEEKRRATRERLEAEGKTILGEAGNSYQGGPSWPGGTLDHAARLGGKKFDREKHAKLKCAGWFITYEGEAVEACADVRKHESKEAQQRHGVNEDPERKRLREERERYVEAMDKLRPRRHDYIKKILAGGLGADARDHVVRQAIFVYEPRWDLAPEWLGIELTDEQLDAASDFAPHFTVLEWIQAAPGTRQLKASLALVLEEAEASVRYDTPGQVGEDMAPLIRQHFEFLSFAGYGLAPEEEAWLHVDQVAEGPERQADTAPDAAASSELGSPELEQERLSGGEPEPLIDLEDVELDPLPDEAEKLPPGDDTEKEHPGHSEPLVEQPLKAETASQRMERERRAKIDAAKAKLAVKPGDVPHGTARLAPGTCVSCGCHGDCPGGCSWVEVDDVSGWVCSTHAETPAAILAREG